VKNVMRSPWTLALALFCIAAAGAAAVGPACAEDNPWAPGTQWLTLRAGYAKSSVEGAGEGGGGYGFGYSLMLGKTRFTHARLLRQLAVGAYLHHEVLGRLASASEIEVPATVELVRHLDWNSQFHPYLGLGAGEFYRKTYRTGSDQRTIRPGYYLTFGGNLPVSRMQLLGVDVRVIRVAASNVPPNPVFGLGSGSYDNLPSGETVIKSHKATHWSVKVGYTRAY
jgi:outer membrane protein W